jgi:hypothetical protein
MPHCSILPHVGGSAAGPHGACSGPDAAPVYSGDRQAEWSIFLGTIHRVLKAHPPNPLYSGEPVHVHTNLAGVNGVGQTTGADNFAIDGSEGALSGYPTSFLTSAG